jgi:ferredoxin, 2Fe-2S
MYTLKFYFGQEGRKTALIKKVKEGQSILEIALKSHIDLQHECGGICACGTCHIYVNKGSHFLEPITRRETAYIKRTPYPLPNSRLSCQCILLEGKGEVEVVIPYQDQQKQ